jgi:hypothetical protein
LLTENLSAFDLDILEDIEATVMLEDVL